MNKRVFSSLSCLIIIMIFAANSFGSGFQIPEQGIAAMGMGMGFIGKADDLSAIYHNPAGLTLLKGTHTYLDVAVIAPKATYTRLGFQGEDTKDDYIPVPLLAVSTDFGGRLNNLVVALGVNAPFGLRSDYDELGAQRYISTNISLTTIYVGPYVAWQVTPNISIGGGVQYVHASAKMGQKVNYGGALYMQALQLNPAMANPALNENPNYDGTVDITDATDKGIAGNLGVLVKLKENLRFGLTWKSAIDLDIKGDVKLNIPTTVTQASGGLMQSLTTKGSTTVALPQIIGAGVSFQPTEKLTVIGDFNWANWSVYKNLDFDFEQNTAYFPDKANPRDWENSFAIRVGAEYWLTEKYAVRVGYLYDKSPIPDNSHGPELPTNDQHGPSIGFGYRWNNLAIDAAYIHLFFIDRIVEESIRDPKPLGDYKCSGNILGVSVAYSF